LGDLGENYDNTKNYVVSYHIANNAAVSLSTAAVTNVDGTADGGGTDDAAATAPVGMSLFANTEAFAVKLEIQAAGGGFIPYNPWPQAAPIMAQ